MTDALQEQLALLARSTNHEQAKANQAKADAFRPRNRCVLEDFEGDFEFLGITKSPGGVSKDGNAYEGRDQATFRVSNLVVYSSVEPFMGNSIDIAVPLSDRLNSQMGLMVASGTELDENFKSAADLHGRHARLVDTVKNNGKGKDGYDINIWYYAFVSLGAAKAGNSNGAKPSDEAIAAALEILEGKTEEAFQMAAVKDERVRADQAMVNSIVSGGFVKELVSAGRVKAGETGYEVMPF